MLQKVLKSNAAWHVMGMHVTLMFASAMSRTRRFILLPIVILQRAKAAVEGTCSRRARSLRRRGRGRT
jgi:hypothetical protein